MRPFVQRLEKDCAGFKSQAVDAQSSLDHCLKLQVLLRFRFFRAPPHFRFNVAISRRKHTNVVEYTCNIRLNLDYHDVRIRISVSPLIVINQSKMSIVSPL